MWTGPFVRICLVNLFVFVNFHALLPTFPFFVRHLGGDAVAIGVATALFSLASIVSRPFVGWMVDTRGRCAILVAGLAGMAMAPAGYCVSAGIALAVVLRTAHGVFHAAASNAASTWVTDVVPPSRMGEGLGMFGLSMAISTALAPAIGLTLMNACGFEPLFALTSAVAVAALAVGVGIRPRGYSLATSPLSIRRLFEPMSAPAAVTQFFFMMAYGMVEVYVAIYTATCGLPGGGVYFVFIAVATVATRFALGRATDRRGEARLVYAGNAAIVGSIVLLVCAHNVPCYLLSAVLLGFSFGAIQPSLQTMAMHAVPPHRRGAANSTFFVAFDSGLALGGFAAGVLIERIGFDAMFLCMIVPCALSTAYYYIYGRRHPSSFNPSSRTAAQPAAAPTPATADAPLVVTISREYGSGGHRTGQMLAHRLGIAFYDRELIDLTAQQSGLDHEQVTGSEQTVDARLACDNPVQTDVYLAQSRIIARLAAQGPCVIVGRLANFVLRGRPNRFDVFVYADANVRARRIAATCGVDADRAAQMVQRSDQERADHCLHYTGRHWGDRHSYHLMIDTSAVSESEAVAMIAAAVGQRRRHGANNAPNAADDGCR